MVYPLYIQLASPADECRSWLTTASAAFDVGQRSVAHSALLNAESLLSSLRDGGAEGSAPICDSLSARLMLARTRLRYIGSERHEALVELEGFRDIWTKKIGADGQSVSNFFCI